MRFTLLTVLPRALAADYPESDWFARHLSIILIIATIPRPSRRRRTPFFFPGFPPRTARLLLCCRRSRKYLSCRRVASLTEFVVVYLMHSRSENNASKLRKQCALFLTTGLVHAYKFAYTAIYNSFYYLLIYDMYNTPRVISIILTD